MGIRPTWPFSVVAGIDYSGKTTVLERLRQDDFPSEFSLAAAYDDARSFSLPQFPLYSLTS